VVDDDPVIRFGICSFLDSKEMEVYEAGGVQRAREQFSAASPDAVILDFSLPDGDGLELLHHFKSIDENLPVIVLTGQGSIELAVRAIKRGADQFLTKPIELAALHTLLARALENKRHRQHSLISQSKAKREQLDPFVGDSMAVEPSPPGHASGNDDQPDPDPRGDRDRKGRPGQVDP
jgi:DNA-binding NtrC family response regulator